MLSNWRSQKSVQPSKWLAKVKTNPRRKPLQAFCERSPGSITLNGCLIGWCHFSWELPTN